MFSKDIDKMVEGRVRDMIIAHATSARHVEDEEDKQYIASETFGEVLDKLIITHIRTWMLVDKLVVASDEEAPAIQRKINHCTHVKRPRLVTALNVMFREIVKGRLDLVDDEYVKVFKDADKSKYPE